MGSSLAVGESVIEYTSINTEGTLNYAFGYIKLAIRVIKDADNILYVEEPARDVYNFEPWWDSDRFNTMSKTLAGMIKMQINDLGYVLQSRGDIQPFVYAIQIQKRILL